MNLIKLITNLASPAGKKQSAYKSQAKRKGLLSAANIVTLSEGGDFNFEELSQKPNFKISSSSIKMSADILSHADENGILKLTDVVLFDEKNFHNLKITDAGYAFLSKDHTLSVAENPEFDCLNVNHQQEPEFAFGSYEITSCDIKLRQIRGTIEMDINHPAFAEQRYSLEKDSDLELGLSIEIGGVCSFDKLTKEIIYSEPKLMGLATTLIPSAPNTLTHMDTNKLASENEATDSLDQLNQGLGLPTDRQKTILSMEPEKTTPDVNVEGAGTPPTPEATPSTESDASAEETENLKSRIDALEAKSKDQDEVIAMQATILSKITSQLSQASSTLSTVNKQVVAMKKPSSINTFSN